MISSVKDLNIIAKNRSQFTSRVKVYEDNHYQDIKKEQGARSPVKFIASGKYTPSVLTKWSEQMDSLHQI